MLRDKSVDIAKGIGIFLVVWGHCFDACPVFNEIYLFHMPLFFFLAGCFLRSEGLKVVLYKRIRTLLAPFLFFYVASLMVKLGRDFMSHPSLDTILTYDYSLKQMNYVLWFIPTLFWALIISNVVAAKKFGGGGKMLLCLLPLSVLGYWLCYSKSFLCEIAYIPQALCATVFVGLGHEYYRLKAKTRWLILSAIVAFPFYAYLEYKQVLMDLGSSNIGSNYLMYVMAAIFGISVTMLISLFVQRYRVSSVLSSLGVYSLFIYGFHVNSNFLTPLLNKTMCLLGNSDVTTYSTSVTFGLVKTFYCLVITYVIGLFLKKYLPFFFGYSKEDRLLQKLKNESNRK